MLYRLIFKLFFTRVDAEAAHHLGMFAIRLAGALGITKFAKLKPSGKGAVQAFGLHFDAPFGLAAGFDKNAVAIRALGELGFSHIEVGTVTALPQPGNEKPRLFRLIPDRALINRMGFNNDGAQLVAKRLETLRSNHPNRLPVIGVNIGKSRAVAVEEAEADYRASARLLAPVADYIAVNVSSPNTPGLRSLQDVDALRPILNAVLDEALGKPVLVKIAPDLADEDILAVADLAREINLAGVIATNTTISREDLKTSKAAVEAAGAGGLSGAPLKARSLEVLRILHARLNGRVAIISVGGVETADEVRERLLNGATLVQGYTGFIYQGPGWARKINRTLSR
ncbi:quinone-dependent dihydroorotate dehydrogenase [Rhodoluna sp.]|uniref:quinone-dependent dihydroorotate dehydrogenase n=1 Tax=Rhodoluna sp. TaxID=1969481 RepID=UPI0025E54018|nr:quinone-dependent dihydroorotate dehydrogenase [Rhodoluna sp.]